MNFACHRISKPQDLSDPFGNVWYMPGRDSIEELNPLSPVLGFALHVVIFLTFLL